MEIIDVKLLTFLKSFLTENRKNKISNVLDCRTEYITVVLENIFHSHNASAVVRNCDSFGIQNLHFIQKDKGYSINKDVAQGAGKWIDIYRYYSEKKDNTELCLKKLKSEGYKIVATTLREEKLVPLDKLPLNNKLALCFGKEELGLSDKTHEMADYYVNIPMHGFSQSFNISVTVAMCLRNLVERLHETDFIWQLDENKRNIKEFDWVVKSIKKNPDMLIKRFYDSNNSNHINES